MDESTDPTPEAHRTGPDWSLPPGWLGVDEQGHIGEVILDTSGIIIMRMPWIGAEWMVPAQSVRPATEDEQARARLAVCRCCGEPTGDPVQVGLTESMSGPGWPIWACRACVQFRRLMPFDEHPLESMGSVRRTDGSWLREAL